MVIPGSAGQAQCSASGQCSQLSTPQPPPDTPLADPQGQSCAVLEGANGRNSSACYHERVLPRGGRVSPAAVRTLSPRATSATRDGPTPSISDHRHQAGGGKKETTRAQRYRSRGWQRTFDKDPSRPSPADIVALLGCEGPRFD